MRQIVYAVAGLVFLTIVYLLAWPVPIDPLAWNPPENPGFSGPYAMNNRLAKAEIFTLPSSQGPEDTALGSDGRIYSGLADGSIVRFSLENIDTIETLVNTGGRPLGLKFHNDRLYIADAFMGLIYIDNATSDGNHKVELAADKSNGEPMLFVDDLDIAEDGTVWFTDASTRFDLHDNILDYMEHRPSGRLISWNPETFEIQVHLDGLAFANGVAFGPDDSYILINETMRYRITRYWLKGKKAGQAEIFAENLPGFPDNLSYNHNGLFWVALIYPREKKIDSLLPRPFLRKVIMRLPETLREREPEPMAWVIALNYNGEVVHNLQDHTGRYHTVTSVNEVEGYLWLGSLTATSVARIAAPE